jgi:hypothetical protein
MTFSDKYNAIRSRLFDDYVFGGLVAAWIDPASDGGEVDFGDQTVYMGQALMVLATEIAANQGLDQGDAVQRINETLQTFEQLDLEAEKYINPDAAEELDGFFLRDDITGVDDPRLGHKFNKVDSDFQNPAQENATPSGDQIFGMMYGLLCVVRYSGDDRLKQRAIANSSRLYDYARRCNFVLKLPDGQETRRGSDVRWLASLLHGLNKAITGIDLFNQSSIEFPLHNLPLNAVGAIWADSDFINLIKEHAGETITIPVIDKDIEINAFALHIMLMALAAQEAWSQADIEDVAVKSNHHLSALWYAQLHGTKPQAFDQAVIQQFLDSCPVDGPKASLDASTGWAHDNRWVRCADIFKRSGGSQLFNGVDWLVLHNLSRIVYP